MMTMVEKEGVEREREREREMDQTHIVLRVLELLKQASHDLQCNPSDLRLTESPDSPSSAAVKALLELEHESASILSSDPNLSKLSLLLTSLKSLLVDVEAPDHRRRHFGLRSFLRRRASAHKIARVAGSIESELQAWIDRESLESLVKSLEQNSDQLLYGYGNGDENENDTDRKLLMTCQLMTQFSNRVSQGFNRDLQDLILKSKIFSKLESLLCNSNLNKNHPITTTTTTPTPNTTKNNNDNNNNNNNLLLLLREHAAFAIDSLIQFNKNVFVGQVLMGPTVQSLISLGTASSLRVLCSLIRSIKSPLVDEIETNGKIPEIIMFLSSHDLDLQVLALDCVLEIGYFGRKDAIDAMLHGGLLQKLIDLQMSDLGGDLIDVGRCEEERDREQADVRDSTDEDINHSQGHAHSHSSTSTSSRDRYLEAHPFASCVARFAVQLEVGEGLRMREKRAFKQEILRRLREDPSLSHAQAATIAAEVLWGSSP